MKKTTFIKILTLFILVQVQMLSGFAATPYTLEQCKQMALSNSLKIKNSQLAVSASAETKKAALTAFFPKVSVMGNYFKNSKDLFAMDIPFMPGLSISMLDRATVLAVTVMQPLFTGGRIIYGNKLANLGTRVEEQKGVLTKNDILLKTEEQYWILVSLDEKIKTLDMYAHMLDDLLKQVNDAYKYGIITRNDVLKVSVKRTELELNKQRLKNGRQLAGMAFCQLLGIEYDADIVLTDALEPVLEPQQYFVPNQQVLQNRAEYVLLQYGLRAEKLKTALKRGEYLPEIGVGVSGFHLNAMNNGGVNNFAAFCSISIPISGWLEASHTLKEKKIKEKIAANTLKDTSELLLLQMQKVWYELTESYKEVTLADELVKQAEENLKVNQDVYQQGVVNISDLLEAQALYQQARVQNIEAQANNRVKLVQYLQVTGRYETYSEKK